MFDHVLLEINNESIVHLLSMYQHLVIYSILRNNHIILYEKGLLFDINDCESQQNSMFCIYQMTVNISSCNKKRITYLHVY